MFRYWSWTWLIKDNKLTLLQLRLMSKVSYKINKRKLLNKKIKNILEFIDKHGFCMHLSVYVDHIWRLMHV